MIMKKSFHSSGYFVLLFVFIVFTMNKDILAQDQNESVIKDKDILSAKLQIPPPSVILMDTTRIILGNYGKGIPYYDCRITKYQEKLNLYSKQREGEPLLLKASFSDMELDILNDNLLFIDEQYRIQIQEWIRKDKLDLNLGEAIKGFYMKPVF